jgi:hypothetical protein
MTKAEQQKTGLQGGDKRQGDLQNPAHPSIDLPEGLTRERKGPLDKSVGRDEKVAHVPGNQ